MLQIIQNLSSDQENWELLNNVGLRQWVYDDMLCSKRKLRPQQSFAGSGLGCPHPTQLTCSKRNLDSKVSRHICKWIPMKERWLAAANIAESRKKLKHFFDKLWKWLTVFGVVLLLMFLWIYYLDCVTLCFYLKQIQVQHRD